MTIASTRNGQYRCRRQVWDRPACKCVLLSLALVVGVVPSAGADECRSLSAVKWLLGDWTTSSSRSVTRESWRRVSDVTFEGESVTTSRSSDKVLNSETLRLVAMSGGVFYIAKVKENDLPIPFRLSRCPGDLAVFENSGHDFPQRLTYRRSDDGKPGEPKRLEVTVDGGEGKGFTLRFARSGPADNDTEPDGGGRAGKRP